MTNIVMVDEANFEEQIASFGGVAVVDFFADWCGPCRMLAPHIEKLAAAHPEIRVAKVDVDRSPRLAARLGVQSIPTVVRFDDGAPTAVAVGALPYAPLRETLRIGESEPRSRAA